MNNLTGKAIDLESYRGKVVLVVNVASECGLTPQYEQLQGLHETFKAKGLAVVGFPCNQFGGQEPGTSEQILSFCKKNYGVTFDVFEKIDVNGEGACDLYRELTSLDSAPTGAGPITWNFEKFLLDRTGRVIGRFPPKTRPDDANLVKAIETALAAD